MVDFDIRELPVLKKVASGWLAINEVPGDRWAVQAPTQEDALRLFYAAVERNRRIDSRQFNEQAEQEC